MPGSSGPTLRPRVYHKIMIPEAEPQHGHYLEYVVAWAGVAVNVGFIIGSVCFLSRWPIAVIFFGDWFFVIGSLVGVCLSMYSIHESHALAKFTEMMQLTGNENNLLRNEFLEQMNFFMAGIVFFIGSLLYMPGIYGPNQEMKEFGAQLGAYCFIAGSMGFVMATFFAAIGMAADPNHQNLQPGSVKTRCHYLHIMGLACSQVGSVFFVTGSVLYRPVFAYGHNTAADAGTRYYIVGSILYTIEALLCLKVCYIKHANDGQDEAKAPKTLSLIHI